MTSYRTALGRARGLGSAKHGAGHWIAERVSAVALAPLVLWAVYSGLFLARADYATAVAWMGRPMNAVLMILLLTVGLWHMMVGVRVVIEDYIHKAPTKVALLIANLFVCVLAGALAVFSTLKVALSGGAF